MKRIRSGRGLGDALYMQSIVRHLVGKGKKLQVCTDYPEIYDFDVEFDEFSRHNINITCHYTKHKADQRTNQWEDICTTAGLKDIELRLDWAIRNPVLVNEVLAMAAGHKILFVHGAREPMQRKDKFGRDLLPNERIFNETLDKLDDFFRLQVGQSDLLYGINADKNLNWQTSVSDLIDIASISDAFYGQCSFIVPLAESFNKPLLAVWSKKGLASGEHYIRTITPKKILSKPTSLHIVDDWNEQCIDLTISEFRFLQEPERTIQRKVNSNSRQRSELPAEQT